MALFPERAELKVVRIQSVQRNRGRKEGKSYFLGNRNKARPGNYCSNAAAS